MMGDRDIDKDSLTLSQLRQMEVIDIAEGRRLGFISDILFDDGMTKIDSLLVPPQGNFFTLFRKREEIQIKWHQIKVIGVDIILVDLNAKNANDI
jgi:YlmC/YmxH family sporulation protein